MPFIQVIFALLFPFLAVYLSKRFKIAGILGPVMLCYFAGIIPANIPQLALHEPTSKLITEATIPLAIPLLLFSTDLKGWLKHSRSAALSFAFATIGVIVASVVTLMFLPTGLEHPHQVAGMLAGTYTGGTPNLLSIGKASGASSASMILLNAADVIVSGAYLLFILSLAKPLLSKLFPPFERSASRPDEAHEAPAPPRRALLKGMALSAGLSVLIAALCAGLTMLIFGKLEVAPILFGLTTCGVLGSLVPRIRALHGSYALGNYLIYVFCVAIGSLTDFTALYESSIDIVIFAACFLLITVTTHYILAKIAKIDVDTLIITSVAAVMGPAFVGLVSDSLHNKEVLLSGMTTGLVGYAVGNYVGLLIIQIMA